MRHVSHICYFISPISNFVYPIFGFIIHKVALHLTVANFYFAIACLYFTDFLSKCDFWIKSHNNFFFFSTLKAKTGFHRLVATNSITKKVLWFHETVIISKVFVTVLWYVPCNWMIINICIVLHTIGWKNTWCDDDFWDWL